MKSEGDHAIYKMVRNKNPAIAGGQNKEHATTWTLHQTLDRMKKGTNYHLGSIDPQEDPVIVQSKKGTRA